MVNDTPIQPNLHNNTVINRTVGSGFVATDEEPNQYMGAYVAFNSQYDVVNDIDSDRPRLHPQYYVRSSVNNILVWTRANHHAMQDLINTHRTLLDTPFEPVDWSRLQANHTLQIRPSSRKRTLEEAFPGINDNDIY